MRVRVVYLLGLAIMPSSLVAQNPDAVAARVVSAAFFKAIVASDWKAAAGFLDLAALDRERQSAVEGARRQRTMPPMTVERLMRMDPEMPRAVAEYQVKRMNRSRQSRNYLQSDFGIADPDSLLALPMEVVAARWLEAHDERAMYREALRASGSCPITPADTAPAQEYRIIGTVVDDSMAYTLFRPGDRGMVPQVQVGLFPPRILQLRQDRGAWWVVPSPDMSSSMAMSIQCASAGLKKSGGA
ncbi:MAG TPA: hypothetical protein VJW73_06635 [Gemmatimonadaceae bacterium]|nr:hypothetical protein [Gemmatimonadaceae bacterium]